MSWKDHFSARAGSYAAFRPTYPPELFAHLASLVPGRERAWDCATGSGQAAVLLAPHFAEVVATDASEAQLAKAQRCERVTYRRATAEESGLEPTSVDLVTVAQALHWFDHERFFAEVGRVLRPKGVLAVWTYDLMHVTPAVDAVLVRFYRDVVGPYWPKERRLVEDGYRSLAFPFRELTVPPFSMTAAWTLEHLLGYLGTWSATEAYAKANGVDPVGSVADEMAFAWGEPGSRTVTWPLAMRVCEI